MRTIKISDLQELSSRTEQSIIPIVQDGITKKITTENYTREPVYDFGSISGVTTLDVSEYRYYIMELDGDVDITITGSKEGERYVLWVLSNGNYSINSFVSDPVKTVYTEGGNIPNPTNNKYNLYEMICMNGHIILFVRNNFSGL